MATVVEARMTGRKRRLTMSLCVVALLTGACFGTSGGPPRGASPSPESTPAGGRLASPPLIHLQVTLRAGQTGPSGVLTWNDQHQTGVRGSTCWEQEPGVTGCGDVSAEVYYPTAYIGVEGATVLYVFGDQTKVAASLLRVTGDHGDPHIRVAQELPLVEGASAIDVRPGRYTLEVDGTWPQGHGPLFFGLLVT